ncbi:hypothetical protein [Bacillus sp. X1(2014)]|uniref:hypothetical protein n=1 Tax=Bacillus sp. X1(2014) TaxID=1565991 RepID=UPI0011A0C52D|nr:hypothetical protein [Bacillus sp. X1(2014)]
MLDVNTSLNKQEEKMKSLTGPIDLQYDELSSFLQENGGNHVSHLIFLKDKEIFRTKKRDVLIVYKRIANKL